MCNHDYPAAKEEKQEPIFISGDLPAKFMDAVLEIAHQGAIEAASMLLELLEQPAGLRANGFGLAPEEIEGGRAA